ncbi:hypothetical protein JR316_0000288 [Psilocybe cubensis]|uniref:Uncharacterized protein n=1 Tax=Psilocybe cubensis TaxID=181762 RepID=A0ACB8HEW0_PSICU|nr:hypothetical protein JR316_0000288 [Psilocybe cubensis]KAH9486224.1 hypothetical protein JR316_0000288 [Psilocybe cubensis]
MTPTIPRWKRIIETALAEYKNQTVIQIATTDNTRPTPRVRSHIFRSFLSHPSHPSLPLLLSSTDIRTPKVSQIANHKAVEIAWWIDGTQQQFRILANVYIVPEPNHPLLAPFRKQLEESKLEAGDAISLYPSTEEWESQRKSMFASMSAHMRASWCRPTPGSPLSLHGGPEAVKNWPTRVVQPDREKMSPEEFKEAQKNWELALSNFALVVIDPYEVDFVDLGGAKGKLDRRWLFVKAREGEYGWKWTEEELVP